MNLLFNNSPLWNVFVALWSSECLIRHNCLQISSLLLSDSHIRISLLTLNSMTTNRPSEVNETGWGVKVVLYLSKSNRN